MAGGSGAGAAFGCGGAATVEPVEGGAATGAATATGIGPEVSGRSAGRATQFTICSTGL